MKIACKIIFPDMRKDIIDEYRNIKQIDNDHIVKVYGALIEETEHNMILLMEIINGFDILKTCTNFQKFG